MTNTMEDVNSTFQALYDSEINFAVTTFWDGGFTAKLGDEMNGFKEVRHCEKWWQVPAALREMALLHCPSSAFARMFRGETVTVTGRGA